MRQLIDEYQVLREVLFEVLPRDLTLNLAVIARIHREIDSAIADAVTAYTDFYAGLQEQFTAVLSHDLRNPLGAAKSSAELVLRYPDRTDRHLILAARIVRSLDQMNRMIEDLLDAGRLRGGENLPIHLRELDLTPLLHGMADDFSMSANQEIRIARQEPCRGVWDEELLRRAIANLVSNAIKYGDPARPITLSVAEPDERVIVSVHNWGNPIAPEDLRRLFENSFRTGSAVKGGKKG